LSREIEIIHGRRSTVNKGEERVHAIMGANGYGKSER